MRMKKIAVFASGTGSNFAAILKEQEKGHLDCVITLLVCDKPGAPVIDIAQKHHIPVFVFDPKSFPDKCSYENEIYLQLKENEAEWIFLAGFMRIIGPTLLTLFKRKIVNIHPSLLPAFPGKDAIGQALAANATETGVTIHYIDSGIDTGPVITQEKVTILPGDTKETLAERIHKTEHRLYPKTINQIIHKGEL